MKLIEKLFSGSIERLEKLTELSLSFNAISVIDKGAFEGIKKLENLGAARKRDRNN